MPQQIVVPTTSGTSLPSVQPSRSEQFLSGITFNLLAISFAAMFTEIVLIRWISTEVRIFAYFQNLALIACFLGFGLGCYWSERRRTLIPCLVAMTVLVVIVTAPIAAWQALLHNISNWLSLSSDAVMWGVHIGHLSPADSLVQAGLSAFILTEFLILLIMAMVPFGQWIGFYLDSARDTVSAYSVNLVGSLIGTWMLVGLAFLYLTPVWWFVFVFASVIVAGQFCRRDLLIAVALLTITAVCLLNHAKGVLTLWSPYQKLQVYKHPGQQFGIDVNNTGYMTIANMTPECLASRPDVASQYRGGSYDSPFSFSVRRERVLIIGAGAGNDAAAALRNGADHVDAVEIDPLIYSLGKRLHPERPYSSPKVNVIINDARNFLRRSTAKYDVIVFGLLDSHTEFSSYSNMRVDNYVYTEEAFEEAKRLLSPDGILVLKFEVRQPWTWMGQRFYAMMERVFAHPPLTYYAPLIGHLLSATIFIESTDSGLWERAAQPQVAGFLAQHKAPFAVSAAGTPPPTTDDWPYVYHRTHTIPRTYLTVSAILLLLSGMLVRRVFKAGQLLTWHFFFLGAGFLLIETQMINRLALYFGTTWVVNSVALTGILTVLVLSNIFVKLCQPRHLSLYFVPLALCLILVYAMNWEQVSVGSRIAGVLLASAYSVPLFFAGVVFTESFRRSASKSNALGANILGAVTGGLAQNYSFVTGMKSLLLIAIAFYIAAAVFQVAANDCTGTGDITAG
jgi:SAM-dependent methyltransferase